MNYKHITVLLQESIDSLNLSQNKNIIDCTLGGAGHSKEILEKISPNGKLVAFDLDPASIENAKNKLEDYKDRIFLIKDNFKNLKQATEEIRKKEKIHGILLDLGLSSYELSDENRGFSFQGNFPLDMSFSGNEEINASYIVNNYSVNDLTKIFREYGEEESAYRIANEIVKFRKDKEIKTTEDLVNIILKVKSFRHKIHPATKVFQALRIEVNQELENLELVLPQAIDILESGGRLAVITFHSLEDRIVKKFFKLESTDCICPPEIPICKCDHKKSIKLINKKPVIPSYEEIKDNPRSRSAKLRIVEKI